MQPAPPPFGYGLYQPPPSKRGRPAVLLWFRTYCALGFLLYGGLFLLLAACFEGSSALGLTILAPLPAAHLVGAVVPLKPWGWTVGLVVICLGFPTFALPLAFALFLFWRDPTVKAAFGRM